MTATTSDKRDLLVWRIRDILSRVRPEDMTDAELEAALAIFSLADARLSPKPKFLIRLDPSSVGGRNVRANRERTEA
jgi:hypothetical protein